MNVAIKQKSLVFLLSLVLMGLLASSFSLVYAVDSSITINSVNLTLHDDDDANGIANIGDTIRVEVDLTNTDEACDSVTASTTVTVDLSAYGGENDEALTCVTPNGGTNDIWRLDFEIANAGGDGIDVAANNASSRVTVTADDEDDVTPVTQVSNNLAEAVDTIAPTITSFNVTGASGAGGVFKRGDTITVTWDNSGDGDNNTDTISTTTVLFFGDDVVVATEEDDIWTATIAVNDLDEIEDTGLNITVTIKDNANNSVSTGTDDVDVDNVAPAKPVATPAAATFSVSRDITLGSTGSDLIRYTLNGTNPTCSTGTLYSGAFTVDTTLTLKVIGCDTAGNESLVLTTEYNKSSSGSGSGSSKTKTVVKGVVPIMAKSVADIINENKMLFVQAHAAGLVLPQIIMDMLDLKNIPAMPVRDITLGMSGVDVQALQNFLIARGHSIPAGATSYFGIQTQSALMEYQKANSITPASGYFGAITRTQMKAAGLAGLWW